MPDRYGTKASRKLARISGADPTANRGRDDSKTIFGNVAEGNIANRLGMRLTAGSGNKIDKGDMTNDTFRLESKATKARSLKLELAWLQKINEQAVSRAQVPALAVQFVDDNSQPVHAGSWVAVPEHVFHSLLELADELSEDD